MPNVLKSLSSEDIVIADILNQEYTGSAICPDITIMDGEMKLVSGTHYTVECSDNVSTGNATATITGIGSYMDEVTRTFEIVPMKLAEYAAVQILEDQNGPDTFGILARPRAQGRRTCLRLRRDWICRHRERTPEPHRSSPHRQRSRVGGVGIRVRHPEWR